MHGRCEVPDLERSVVDSGVKPDFEKWNWCALSWRKLLDLFPASMTCTKYCSACWIKEGTNGAVAPNPCKFATGSALRAAIFVPILLVISHPVRLCSAGSTVHIRVPSLSCKIWRGTNRVVLPLPAFTHSSEDPTTGQLLHQYRWILQRMFCNLLEDNPRHASEYEDLLPQSETAGAAWYLLFHHGSLCTAIHYCLCIAGWEWLVLYAIPKNCHASIHRLMFPAALCSGLTARMLSCPWELVLWVQLSWEPPELCYIFSTSLYLLLMGRHCKCQIRKLAKIISACFEWLERPCYSYKGINFVAAILKFKMAAPW